MSLKVLIKIEADECVPVSLTFKVYTKDILLVFEKPFSLFFIYSVNRSSCRCVCFYRSSNLQTRLLPELLQSLSEVYSLLFCQDCKVIFKRPCKRILLFR